MQSGFSRPSINTQLRPKLMWYVVAVLIALAGSVSGGLMMGYGMGATSAPFTQFFDAGQTVTVYLDGNTAIYVPESSEGAAATCGATSADGKVAAVRGHLTTPVKRVDGKVWILYREIRIAEPDSPPGNYRVTCAHGPGPYALADQPNMSRYHVGLLSLFALPGIGILLAAIMIGILTVKRNNHLQQLMAERLGQTQP